MSLKPPFLSKRLAGIRYAKLAAPVFALGAGLLIGGGSVLASGCSSARTSPAPDAGRDASSDVKTDAAADADHGGADADSDALSDPGTAPDADASSGDASCTGADLAARWAAMLASPIRPPNHYANLDLGGASGAGLTLAEAEAVNCAGTIFTADDAGKWPSMTWGPHGEITMSYDQFSHVAVSVFIGKAPPFTFKSRDGKHDYVIALGQARNQGRSAVRDRLDLPDNTRRGGDGARRRSARHLRAPAPGEHGLRKGDGVATQLPGIP